MLTRALVALILVLAVATSCAREAKPPFLGMWEEDGGSEVTKFLPDGMVTVRGFDGNYNGKWKLLDDGRLRLKLGGLGRLVGPMIFEWKVEDLKLVMTDADGTTSTYSKVE